MANKPQISAAISETDELIEREVSEFHSRAESNLGFRISPPRITLVDLGDLGLAFWRLCLPRSAGCLRSLCCSRRRSNFCNMEQELARTESQDHTGRESLPTSGTLDLILVYLFCDSPIRPSIKRANRERAFSTIVLNLRSSPTEACS